ncbi:Photosystem I P700 chlorophyll a apoprotein A1 [Platanthera zijinensis]|uniref:Photosystem I P700 chlorophyll a apoprotein A1 n=1 Tax=Platanthera zijinensis TaxID=2320716 RepID=A0AAP0B2V0_9ASPA
MYFHGARFSNYEAWLSDPTHIAPSAQVVWPIVGQEILNGDVGGGFRGIQITSGFFRFGEHLESLVNYNSIVPQLVHWSLHR